MIKHMRPGRIALFPAVFLYSELLLRFFAGGEILHNFWYILAGTISAGLFASFLTVFWKASVRHLLQGIVLFLSAVWFIMQTLLNRVYAVYFSPASIGTGAGGVASQYTDMLLRTVLLGIPVMLIYFLPLILYLAACFHIRKDPPAEEPCVSRRASAICAGALLLCSLAVHYAAAYAEKTGRDGDFYTSAYTFDNAVRTFGLLTATHLEANYLLFGSDEVSAFELDTGYSYVPDADISYVPDAAAGSSDAAAAVSSDAVSAVSTDYNSYGSETGGSAGSADGDGADALYVSGSDDSAAAEDAEAAEDAGSLQTAYARPAGASRGAALIIKTSQRTAAGGGILPEQDSLQTSEEEERHSSGPGKIKVSLSGKEERRPAAGAGPQKIETAEDDKGETAGFRATHETKALVIKSKDFPQESPKDEPEEVPAEPEPEEPEEVPAEPEPEEPEEVPAEPEPEEPEKVPAAEAETDLSDTEEAAAAPEEQAPPSPNAMDLDFAELAEKSSGPAKAISEYVSTLAPSMKNRYTGIFEGKNLILICAEAYNDSFVSRELTPTLWRLSHNGFWFSDFYQPAWGGSTSTGEFSMLFGLAPQNSAATIRQTQNSNNYFTMGNQLQRQGYHSWAFHNGTSTFYSRDLTHRNLGYDEWIAMGSGLEKLSGGQYLNDEEMVDVTMDLYLDRQPFSVYYMSVSGHAPYANPNDEKVTAHIDRVKEVLGDHFDDFSQNTINYICYQMVLEDALTLMVRRLEDAGILEDTVIAMTGDHYPYGLRGSDWGNSADNIADLIGHEADTPWGLDKTGCVIWSGCLETDYRDMAVEIDMPSYSLDMLPTLSNLFGLEYDSRLLIGRDVFSDAMPLVLWNNGSWVTARGRYNARTGVYEPAESYKNAEETPHSPAAAAAEESSAGTGTSKKKNAAQSAASGRKEASVSEGSDRTAVSWPASSGKRKDAPGIRHTGVIYKTGLPLKEEFPDMGHLPVLKMPSGVDPASIGPEDEKEYTEWIRSLVKNRLAFSKQVIDNNYYETLFGKDEDS